MKLIYFEIKHSINSEQNFLRVFKIEIFCGSATYRVRNDNNPANAPQVMVLTILSARFLTKKELYFYRQVIERIGQPFNNYCLLNVVQAG